MDKLQIIQGWMGRDLLGLFMGSRGGGVMFSLHLLLSKSKSAAQRDPVGASEFFSGLYL